MSETMTLAMVADILANDARCTRDGLQAVHSADSFEVLAATVRAADELMGRCEKTLTDARTHYGPPGDNCLGEPMVARIDATLADIRKIRGGGGQ